ncbi:MAG TPA: glycosyltransferase family 2 protein [Oculatellaceae cyanobacterium]
MSGTSTTSTTNHPLVSIVTPSFNQAHFIEKTILSVLLQDYVNLEYIVLDAESNDGTKEIMDKYSSSARMIREKDEGQADAINKGFRLAKGSILAYLNSDDCYANSKVVSRVVSLFEQHPDVDVIIGKREFIDERGNYVLNYPFREFVPEQLLRSCYVPQECAFWRKSIYEKAGDCVDKSFKFAMDYDLWLRFLAAGAKFLNVDEYFGLFRWYPGQKSTDIWRRHGVPEIARLQEKHLGAAMPEDEMIAVYQEYWYGSNRLHNKNVYKHSVPTWQTFTSYKKQLLSNCTRDAWVFSDFISIPKRKSYV